MYKILDKLIHQMKGMIAEQHQALGKFYSNYGIVIFKVGPDYQYGHNRSQEKPKLTI